MSTTKSVRVHDHPSEAMSDGLAAVALGTEETAGAELFDRGDLGKQYGALLAQCCERRERTQRIPQKLPAEITIRIAPYPYSLNGFTTF